MGCNCRRLWDKTEEEAIIKYWENDMNITVPLSTNTYWGMNITDPLVSITFAKYPDIIARANRFVGGDMSALSSPGLILLNFIPESSDDPMYR